MALVSTGAQPGALALHEPFDLSPPVGHVAAATTFAIASDGSLSCASGIQTKEGLNQKGGLITKSPACCQPASLPPQTRLQTGCSMSGQACLGMAGGPVGRQSQLSRKVPLNLPCCL